MRSYVERAQDFVKQVFPYLMKANFQRWATKQIIEEFNYIYHRKVLFRSGIARFALITSDYVVKYTYDKEEASEVGGGEEEIALYEQAEKDGFAYLFAKVTRFVYNDHVFYIMPRIYGISEGNGYAEYRMTREERAWCDSHRLSDLHCNNYGFRNGHICIVDYACTLEECDSYESESFITSEEEVSEG